MAALGPPSVALAPSCSLSPGISPRTPLYISYPIGLSYSLRISRPLPFFLGPSGVCRVCRFLFSPLSFVTFRPPKNANNSNHILFSTNKCVLNSHVSLYTANPTQQWPLLDTTLSRLISPIGYALANRPTASSYQSVGPHLPIGSSLGSILQNAVPNSQRCQGLEYHRVLIPRGVKDSEYRES